MNQIIIVFILTIIIQSISTLSYSVRIIGVRTRRIAVSFALFNILVLVSRTSNSFQAPFLAKKIELDILTGNVLSAEIDFRILILAASIGTLVISFFIPSFHGNYNSTGYFYTCNKNYCANIWYLVIRDL